MNRRRHPQQGIALITTLIMLSVVTLMAVAFLAVSRRERSAVTTSSDRIDAREMADAAAQRAEAEIVARVLARTNLLEYQFLVSTNYASPIGFVRGDTNIANVSYVFGDGSPVEGDDLLELYRNLQIDPRVPVFVITNNITGEQDFRFFLDLNRNGLYETNGIQIELDRGGRPMGMTNFHVGDPEWIGVLRRPDLPHSGSNHFVGRFAYVILPAGKSLDLNFIHNQAKRLRADDDGYHRNQGAGSWELNLAAFLRDLNTNAWNGYDYLTNLGVPSRRIAFDNALTLLRNRYRKNPYDLRPQWSNLSSVRQLFGNAGVRAFLRDGNDGYGDGPIQLGIARPYNPAAPGQPIEILEDDEPAEAWPGSDSPSQYFDPQELFQVSERLFRPLTPVIDEFTNRLIQASLGPGTYDRHTFYRLLAQLGTDSVPANRGQIHLFYDNRLDFDPALAGSDPSRFVGWHATNFVRWTPTAFFTNAADQILKTLNPPPSPFVPLLSVNNVAIWPTNRYTPAVHRAFQLAANLYDATTNDSPTGYPFFPTVFRPVYSTNPPAARIAGYEDITRTWERDLWNRPLFDIDEGPQGTNTYDRYVRVAGIPVVIGAKKGFPNFNEFELQTTVVASRKLEVRKLVPTARPSSTNQLYILGISNVFGVEFWNSYPAGYPRQLELRARLDIKAALSNENGWVWPTDGPFSGVAGYTNTFAPGEWQGGQFRIPIHTNLLFLPMSAYRMAKADFVPIRSNLATNLFEFAPGFPIPIWRLAVTTRLQAALIDRSVPGGRLVDYIDLDNLNSEIDITRELFGRQNDAGLSSTIGSFWNTNRVNGVPEGIANQVQAALGSLTVSAWNSASAEPTQGQDKEKSIDRFRQFLGLAATPVPPSPTLRMQVPFTPGIKLFHNKSWQVNDPLVNDLYWDLQDPTRTNLIERLPPLYAVGSDRSNIGKINHRHRPWQRGLYSSGDDTDFDVSVKDPQVTGSQDWDFPTNAFPSLGWIGRVHRGTPWQTVYLKSPAVAPQRWALWSGHPDWIWPGNIVAPGTSPTNDWRLLEIFTTAVNENAARGLLSVNQEGLAAWSAVLSGVPVLTNQLSTNLGTALVEPNTPELRAIVEGINRTRATRYGERFNYLGEILSTPELTVGSPFLRVTRGQLGTPADAVVERIPQMVLSLIKRDDPRMVILAYGQSLKPAPASVVTEPGPFFQMPTNYVITGEYVTKTLMRLEGYLDPVDGRPRVRPVKESYNEVPPTE